MPSSDNVDKQTISVDASIVDAILRYAGLCVRQGFVTNTLGNIAVRTKAPGVDGYGEAYTKHRGVSLEEMTSGNVVITDVEHGKLLHGEIAPSLGHQLNRIVFMERADVNAVIHLHVNEVIGYFSNEAQPELRFISEDTPLILEKPLYVLAPDENVELVPDTIPGFIHNTNCFVMPHHGITTVGETLSQAYHRLTSVVAEIRRVITANNVSSMHGRSIRFIPQEHVEGMLRDGRRIVYGDRTPASYAR